MQVLSEQKGTKDMEIDIKPDNQLSCYHCGLIGCNNDQCMITCGEEKKLVKPNIADVFEKE